MRVIVIISVLVVVVNVESYSVVLCLCLWWMTSTACSIMDRCTTILFSEIVEIMKRQGLEYC